MSLEQKLLADYKDAMKARDQKRISIISLIRSELNYAHIERQKKELDDPDVLTVIKKMIKQHRDSIEQFKQGGRTELAEKEAFELSVLEGYLPAQLAEAQIKAIIEDVVKATGAVNIKDMGKVMKEVTAQCAGKADGKLVSDLVRQRLSS
jgi:uncharacterized protein